MWGVCVGGGGRGWGKEMGKMIIILFIMNIVCISVCVCVCVCNGPYGVPNVSKTLTNAVFVYLPLIYKCGTDLAKYLPDLYIWA